MEREQFKTSDGRHISFCVWDKVENPKAVLQIVHGMAEHILRYEDFANFMNSNGYIVMGDDHRAHGETDKNNLGQAVGGGDLFENTVKDERGLTNLCKSRWKLPVIVLGHSYGSFLMQRYLTLGTEEIAGVILSGSAFMKGMLVNLGYKMAFSKCKKEKGNEPGATFAKMTFSKYDKKFPEGKNSWLTRDVQIVGKYNVDPLCGFVCSNEFYKFMFGGFKTIAENKGEKIDKNIKMLIASGSLDPVGGYSKLVIALKEHYESMGIKPQLHLYENARHEILNETNREEVYKDILTFADSCL